MNLSLKKTTVKNHVKMYIAAFIFTFIVLFAVQTVFGYRLLGTRCVTRGTTYIYSSNLSSTYKNAWDNGASSWSRANANITYSNYSKNVCSTYFNMGDNSHGYTTIYANPSSFYVNYFDSFLNTGAPNANNTTILRSAAAHEFGHVLGLDHFSNSTSAIMNTSRDRTKIYTPQTDDINGINAIYR